MNYFENLNKVLVIAEIGVNHNGDLDLAQRLIEAAKKSGADAVKFQTFTADSLALANTPKVRYQLATTSNHQSHFEMLRKLELSRENHYRLRDYSLACGIEFFSTPYDIQSAKFLAEMNLSLMKTSSADIVDLPLHRYIASTGIPTLIATGMSTLTEVERIVEVYEEYKNNSIVLLHCVSNYPCSDDSLNLNAMKLMADVLNTNVGFSDHSIGNLASVASVALGARVIEKHFTLDKNMLGPDHKASSTPEEFAELVECVRTTEKMLGNKRKKCQPEEIQMSKVSRKSITLVKSINAGECIKIGDITLKRPGTGIQGNFIDDVVGKIINKRLEAGYQLNWTDLVI